MFKFLLMFVFYVCLSNSLLIAQTPTRQPLDRILANVGSEVILMSDLQKAVSQATQGRGELLPNGEWQGSELSEAEIEDIYNQLIDKKVIIQKIKDLGLQLTESEIDNEIRKTILEPHQLTMDELKKNIEAEGMTWDEYRQEFRYQIELMRLISQNLQHKIIITEDDIKNYYLQNRIKNKQKEQKVKLRSLMIEFPSQLSEIQRKELQDKINNIQRDITTTPLELLDFSKLVRQYSNTQDAQRGGDIIIRELAALPSSVREKISPSTPIGQVIGPIELGSSVFFFQYLGFEIPQDDFSKERPILERKLREERMQQVLQDYVQRERAKIKIQKRSWKQNTQTQP